MFLDVLVATLRDAEVDDTDRVWVSQRRGGEGTGPLCEVGVVTRTTQLRVETRGATIWSTISPAAQPIG